MYARVTSFEGVPEQNDEAIRYTCEHVIPDLQRIDGFKGFYWLGEPHGGKAMVVTLWDSEPAMRASEEAAAGLRDGTEDTLGAGAGGIERYEVVMQVGGGRGSLAPVPCD